MSDKNPFPICLFVVHSKYKGFIVDPLDRSLIYEQAYTFTFYTEPKNKRISSDIRDTVYSLFKAQLKQFNIAYHKTDYRLVVDVSGIEAYFDNWMLNFSDRTTDQYMCLIEDSEQLTKLFQKLQSRKGVITDLLKQL
jgi:hypothetical protein